MGNLRLGVVGYYGYGNYGDELFLDAFGKYLGGFEFVFLQDQLSRPYYTKSLEEKVDGLDAILIGGGDLVIPTYWSDQYFESAFLRKPVYMHGLGVPTWGGEDPGVVARLAKFFGHANIRAITVRDEESRLWIERKLAPAVPVEVTPDIVCSLDLPPARPCTQPGVFGLITRKQNPGEIQWSNIRNLCDKASALGLRIRHISLGTGAIGREDQAAVAEFAYPDMEMIASESLDDLTIAIGECSALASMKFHGCLVAMMYGVPAIGLITTDKFRNFYKTIGRPELLAHHTHTDLPERLGSAILPVADASRQRLRIAAADGLQKLRERLVRDLG